MLKAIISLENYARLKMLMYNNFNITTMRFFYYFIGTNLCNLAFILYILSLQYDGLSLFNFISEFTMFAPYYYFFAFGPIIASCLILALLDAYSFKLNKYFKNIRKFKYFFMRMMLYLITFVVASMLATIVHMLLADIFSGFAYHFNVIQLVKTAFGITCAGFKPMLLTAFMLAMTDLCRLPSKI
jgi:hypothetical protein